MGMLKERIASALKDSYDCLIAKALPKNRSTRIRRDAFFYQPYFLEPSKADIDWDKEKGKHCTYADLLILAEELNTMLVAIGDNISLALEDEAVSAINEQINATNERLLNIESRLDCYESDQFIVNVIAKINERQVQGGLNDKQ